jgi:glycosyltransferase involved in cell wall biosynthesis
VPRAIIFRERLIAPSETFIVEQALALRRYRPVLAGLRRTEPRLAHVLPEVLLSEGAGIRDKVVAHLYRDMPLARRFFQRLAEMNPSIIHAHFAVDAVQALPIADALRLPLVVSLHGFDVTASDESHRKSYSGCHYLSHRAKLFARASVFLCVSKSIQEAALGRGFPEEKLHLHYTGVDCERFQPAPVERDPKLVLFVGRLVEKKGCEYLLRAMALVQQQDAKARLDIIGDGPLRSELEALAKTLGIRARFRGMLDPEEVQASMSRARVLCNPSVTAASGDVEGFGMVFAEAQAVGTPVVSSAHAAIPEAVNHGVTGLLCPERSAGPLAEALLTFLSDDSFWFRASQYAALWVRDHFDIARQTRKLEMIYDGCLEQSLRISSMPGSGSRIRGGVGPLVAVSEFRADAALDRSVCSIAIPGLGIRAKRLTPRS